MARVIISLTRVERSVLVSIVLLNLVRSVGSKGSDRAKWFDLASTSRLRRCLVRTENERS